MQSFHIEGKMSFLDEDEQILNELMCSKCKNNVRTKIIKATICDNCQQHTMSTPRYNELLMVISTLNLLSIYLGNSAC